jgi:hypothetical protein
VQPPRKPIRGPSPTPRESACDVFVQCNVSASIVPAAAIATTPPWWSPRETSTHCIQHGGSSRGDTVSPQVSHVEEASGQDEVRRPGAAVGALSHPRFSARCACSLPGFGHRRLENAAFDILRSVEYTEARSSSLVHTQSGAQPTSVRSMNTGRSMSRVRPALAGIWVCLGWRFTFRALVRPHE